jgi:mannosyltransferase OCH1-like enzyme
MWNEKFPEYQINGYTNYPFVLQIEYLKKLHLYFNGGIYSDFDTEIDETCW